MDEKIYVFFLQTLKIKINMKERYKVLKKIYPYYLILIKKNNKYYTFYEDKLIYKNIKNLNNINYIVLNNLEIEIKNNMKIIIIYIIIQNIN